MWRTPMYSGMRIRVQDIIGLLASGASRDEILQAYLIWTAMAAGLDAGIF
jgi:uncharacterized protein (DUF433 family)